MKVSRVCTSCGKQHNTLVLDRMTGGIGLYIDKCIDCLMAECYFKHPTEQIVLNKEKD